MREDWVEVELEKVVEIHDNLRKPINSKERINRTAGKKAGELYPYYGATGQVGFIDDYLTEGDYILIGEDAAPFLDFAKNVAYPIHGKTWVNNHAHILKSSFNDSFLLHYLNQFQYREYVTGTTRLKLTQGALKRIPVRLAPLPEQRAIVAKIEALFSELDSGIQNLKTAQQQLKVYRQAVLKKAFEGGFTNDSVKESGLPEGWKWVKLDEIAKAVDPQPSHRTPPEVSNGVPYVSIADIDKKTGAINFDSARQVGEYVLREHIDRYSLNEGDFVIGKIGTIGRPFYVPTARFFTLSANVVLVQPYEQKANPKYLFHLINSPIIEEQFKDGAKATTQSAFGIKKVRLLDIPIPPTVGFQSQIVQEIESRLSVCDKMEESISESLEKAEALRQSILKKAFEGKLLSEAELSACRKEADWEPAEKLVERVRNKTA
ncbi:restriction endonuclease subunit S [Marinoscillum sp.]|uniref:restriction endonuclease subunit S n=1 Tax=Marinoscillum sp. TaxID=2024838 RepID=UPI003BAA95D4